jgi:hypothetical protein
MLALRFIIAWPILVLSACAVTAPIQPAATTSSAFATTAYKGTTTTIRQPTSGAVAYRVFMQGSSGFVSIGSVRDDAERRATDFCSRHGGAMDALSETTADPPYILGNFPRIEIVFECVLSASVAPAATGDEYTKLAELKKLLDSGAITQAEFESEKAKVLHGP